jgi:hypothetical protein
MLPTFETVTKGLPFTVIVVSIWFEQDWLDPEYTTIFTS